MRYSEAQYNVFRKEVQSMKEAIIAALTAKEDASACALTERILAESLTDDRWY